jgi:hypothetical protein
MPLAKDGPSVDTTGNEKARETFEKLNKSFAGMPNTTETVSFRVPRGERARLRLLFQRRGMSLANGLKAALYEYLERHDLS